MALAWIPFAKVARPAYELSIELLYKKRYRYVRAMAIDPLSYFLSLSGTGSLAGIQVEIPFVASL